jgi:DNA-binding PucR family transcriptional regulator
VEPSVGDLLAASAASLRAQVPQLCAALVAQMTREVPELAADKPIGELLDASVLANVSTALNVLATGTVDAQVEAPAAAVEYARRLAQRGVAISALLRAYRLGQAGFQQQMIQAVSAATKDPATLVQASLQLSNITFDYIDRISEQVVSAYQLERDRWMRNRGAIRSARVTAVLAGGTVDIDETEKSIGYPLRQTHRGAVVWIEDSSAGPDRLNHLERVIGRLAERLGSDRAPLVIAPDDSTVWAWLPVPVTPVDAGLAKPIAADDGTWIALGDAASGVEGFRLTHRQARQAQIVAMASESQARARVTESAQIGVVALMCADIDAVRAWVHHVLGALAIADEGNARLRDTVRVFLTAGGSYTAAAQQLMLHKNTVQYRIRKAEEARGRPLTDARLDVEVALLAAHLLGAKVLQVPPSHR